MIMKKNVVEQHHHHFLIVTFGTQGHINPAGKLARRLVRVSGARVTISTGLSAHCKLFRGRPDRIEEDEEEEDQDGLISYVPYSDVVRGPDFFVRMKLAGSKSLSHVVGSLAERGRPVTCIIYTILLSWAADVGDAFGIPSVPFWVQPAAVFAILHRYFHGASDLISAHADDPSFALELPGLPPLLAADLPSFLVQDKINGTDSSFLIDAFREMFQTIDREAATWRARSLKLKLKLKPMVLVNTFESLEPNELLSSIDGLELMPVGPMVNDSRLELRRDLFEDDSGGEYMEWLDSKEEENSVVYVSFGSLAHVSKIQLEEIHKGLEESGWPYLWVVRKDAKEKLEGGGGGAAVFVRGGGTSGGRGLVVEWCDQARVLSHRAVGCFVTHCGWNSVVESLACGVPTVALPQWADQPTNARLVEAAWAAGVRARLNGEGVAEAAEVARCLEAVMGGEGGGGGGAGVRRSAEEWRERAAEALGEGGSSDRNLKAFVDAIGSSFAVLAGEGELQTGANVVVDPIGVYAT